MREEVLPAELSDKIGVRRRFPPAREGVVKREEVGVVCSTERRRHQSANDWVTSIKSSRDVPILNEDLARSASCSRPKGATKGDFELRVAAMVRAGSRHLKRAAVRRNLPTAMRD